MCWYGVGAVIRESIEYARALPVEHFKFLWGGNMYLWETYPGLPPPPQIKPWKGIFSTPNPKQDFGLSAEWHFSATSHGKGALVVLSNDWQLYI